MIDINDTYPGESNSANDSYPYGSARNEITLNDGTGFPLEAAWVNDIIGFMQSVIKDQGIAPNGTPESVSNGQLLRALKSIKEFYSVSAMGDKKGAYDGEGVFLVGVGFYFWSSQSTATADGVNVIGLWQAGRWIRWTDTLLSLASHVHNGTDAGKVSFNNLRGITNYLAYTYLMSGVSGTDAEKTATIDFSVIPATDYPIGKQVTVHLRRFVAAAEENGTDATLTTETLWPTGLYSTTHPLFIPVIVHNGTSGAVAPGMLYINTNGLWHIQVAKSDANNFISYDTLNWKTTGYKGFPEQTVSYILL